MAGVVVERLNLDGDDAEDFVFELETSFGIEFGRKLDWTTAGDILRAVEERMTPSGKAGPCATSMTFYRIRRAVQDQLGRSPIPSTPLIGVLGPNQSATAKKLAGASGLRIIGPNFTWRGKIGCLTLFAAILPFLFTLTELVSGVLAGSLIGIGILLLKTDPGRYAEHTFGEWVRSISHQNAGLLMSLGADRRPKSLWAAIASMLEAFSGVPADQIGLNTKLWPLEKKRAA